MKLLMVSGSMVRVDTLWWAKLSMLNALVYQIIGPSCSGGLNHAGAGTTPKEDRSKFNLFAHWTMHCICSHYYEVMQLHATCLAIISFVFIAFFVSVPLWNSCTWFVLDVACGCGPLGSDYELSCFVSLVVLLLVFLNIWRCSWSFSAIQVSEEVNSSTITMLAK